MGSRLVMIRTAFLIPYLVLVVSLPCSRGDKLQKYHFFQLTASDRCSPSPSYPAVDNASGLAIGSLQAAEKKGGGNVLSGTVKDGAGQAIERATVYLVPSADVEAMGKTPLEVKRNSPNDEPLDDNVAANIDKYKRGVADKKGNFRIADIPEGRYFIYVLPSGNAYLPGGDKSGMRRTPSAQAATRGSPM
jgi:hypothetical protein